MLFLCDVYTNWCDSQNLPNFYSADDLCYGRDTKDKLTLKQKNWLLMFEIKVRSAVSFLV